MNKYHLNIVGLICLVLLLSACFSQKTPQQVTQAFWQAVISNNAKGAVEYSTLTDEQGYDKFSRDWSGFEPSWGKVVIDGNQASIVSSFYKVDSTGTHNRKLISYLVHQSEQWRVDYARTAKQMRGGSLTNLFDQLGQTISDQLTASSKDISAEMEHMGEELEAISDSINQQASESINRHAEDLRRRIDELAESVQRALKEQHRKLSDKDRRTLNEVADDLNKDSEKLSRPGIQSITDGSKSVGKAQQRLVAMDDEAVGEYKQQWQQWQDEFEADLHEIFAEFSSFTEKP